MSREVLPGAAAGAAAGKAEPGNRGGDQTGARHHQHLPGGPKLWQ